MTGDYARDFQMYDFDIPGHAQFAVGTVKGSPCYEELPRMLGPLSENRMVVIGLWHHAGWLIGMLPVTCQLVIVTPFSDETLPNQLLVSKERTEWSRAMSLACRDLMLLVRIHLGRTHACTQKTSEVLFNWCQFGQSIARRANKPMLDSLTRAVETSEQNVIKRLKRMLQEQADHFTLLSYVPEEDAS